MASPRYRGVGADATEQRILKQSLERGVGEASGEGGEGDPGSTLEAGSCGEKAGSEGCLGAPWNEVGNPV